MTWQVSPRNKLSVYADKIWKSRGAAMNPGDDPDTSSVVWTSPLYLTNTAKWTSTVSNKLLVDGGYSMNIERYENLDQPGLAQTWGTPAWLAGAPYRDSALGTTSHAVSTATGGGEYQKSPDRYNLQGSASYVTGSHNVKFGVQHSWGRDGSTLRQNADLVQNYLNGVPSTVVLEGTANPRTYWTERLNANLGIYAQDQWTFNRLTLNYALRWEYVSEQVDGQPAQSGRFANIPAFGDIKMPIWKNWSPRASAIYDLTGDGKTAVRFGFNRFQSAATTTFASLYDPANALVIQTTAPWTDKNRDNIAQGIPGCSFATDPACEINFATVPTNFGTISLSSPDPNVTRPYARLVQPRHHARSAGGILAVLRLVPELRQRPARAQQRPAAGRPQCRWNSHQPELPTGDGLQPHRWPRHHDVRHGVCGRAAGGQERGHQRPESDAALRRLRDQLQRAAAEDGAAIFGGSATDRAIANTCSAAATNPNLLNYCDQTQSGIPWRTQFKLVATYEIPWGVQVSGAFQSLPGYFNNAPFVPALQAGGSGTPNLTNVSGLGSIITVVPSTRYVVCPGNSAAAGCTVGALIVPGMNSASFSVPLVAPSTENTPRITQLDLAVSKRITVKRIKLEPKIDVFNALNSSDYFSVRTTTFSPTSVPGVSAPGTGGTPAAYLAPSSILQGRLLRVGINVTW